MQKNDRELKQLEKLDSRELRINKALKELEDLRREDFSVDFIKQVHKEFDDLQWSTEKCVRKIQDCKYRDIIGRIRFSDFVEERNLVSYRLVESLAMEYLHKRGVVPLVKYNSLVQEHEALLRETKEKKISAPLQEETPEKNSSLDNLCKEIQEIIMTYFIDSYFSVYKFTCEGDKMQTMKSFDDIFAKAKPKIDTAIEELKETKRHGII